MKLICLILAIGCSFLACTESDSDNDIVGRIDGSATDGGELNESGSGAGGTSSGTGGTSSGTGGASSGTGGASSGTGGASNNTGAECSRDADCYLVSDCCGACESFPEGEGTLVCMMACDIESDGCVQIGVVGAGCVDGSCETQFNCDESDVLCDMMISCIEGLVPSVVGGCYGDCVEPNRCAP